MAKVRPGVLTMCSDLLDAVLSYRDVVKAALSESARKSLDKGEEVYIGVLSAGGWECEHLCTARQPWSLC